MYSVVSIILNMIFCVCTARIVANLLIYCHDLETIFPSRALALALVRGLLLTAQLVSTKKEKVGKKKKKKKTLATKFINNSLHLARKYATERCFRGRYLFREENSLSRA